MIEQERTGNAQVEYVEKRIEGHIGYLDWNAWYNGRWAFGLTPRDKFNTEFTKIA